MFSSLLYIALALFALGFSIFIHELGHFIAAKKRGLVADRFSTLFFPLTGVNQFFAVSVGILL